MNKNDIVSAEIITDIHGYQGMIKITTNDEVYWIPNKTPNNRHYQEYLEWKAEGNTPEEAE